MTNARLLGLRRVAIGLAALAVLVLVVLDRTVGFPRSPEGGVLPQDLQADLQHALLAVAAVAVVAALRAPGIAGAVLAICGAGLGVLASLQYHPLVGLVPYLALLVPAAALLALRIGPERRRLTGLAAVLVAISAVGAFAAQEVHAYFYGPTHPVSRVQLPDAVDVEWAWVGAVTTTEATVKAGLVSAPADAAAVRLLVQEAGADEPGAPAAASLAPSGERTVATFALTGLRPDTEYRYAVEVEGRVDAARRGRFRTFPRGPASFTVAFGGCARIGSNGRVFDAIRALDPTLMLLLGDLYYGNVSENDPDQFRRHYERLLSRPAQSALYRSVPVDYVWDDHDFGPDGAGADNPARPAARQVYGELFPHYALPAGDGGPIYHAFDIGRVRFIVTDLRSARDAPDEPDGPDKTMLGTAQKAWLEQQLLEASRTRALVVLVSSVPWIASAAPGSDGWGGYASERDELGRFMAANGIDNLLMLAGDAHMIAIDDGSHSGYGGAAGFPLIHAATLDQLGATKGGPYSEGMYPGSGQFGTVEVHDDGGRVDVTLTGRKWDGSTVLQYRFAVDGPTGR
jgi:hypothetical protein